MSGSNKAILSIFDAIEEFKANRYVFDRTVGLGKLNKLYCEPRFDSKGAVVEVISFPADRLDNINLNLLPYPVFFIPSVYDYEKWNIHRLGEDWDEHPEKVLKEFGIPFYDRDCDSVINDDDIQVYLACSGGSYLSRTAVRVDHSEARFDHLDAYQGCCFVPVFFNCDIIDDISILDDLV